MGRSFHKRSKHRATVWAGIFLPYSFNISERPSWCLEERSSCANGIVAQSDRSRIFWVIESHLGLARSPQQKSFQEQLDRPKRSGSSSEEPWKLHTTQLDRAEMDMRELGISFCFGRSRSALSPKWSSFPHIRTERVRKVSECQGRSDARVSVFEMANVICYVIVFLFLFYRYVMLNPVEIIRQTLRGQYSWRLF